MALTRGFIRNAATTPLDARLMDMAGIVCNADGSPRVGVLGSANPSIVTALATMNVAIAAAEFVTSKGKADGVAIFTNDGTVNVAITAAPASNSRIDVIWVRHQDNTTGDAASTPIFGVTAGVAAASPTKPAIPTGALELATLRVYAGTTAANGGANVLTNTYQMTAARGGDVPFRSKVELDAWTTAVTGQRAVISGTHYAWTGAAWSLDDATDSGWAALTMGSGWTAVSGYTPRVRRVGKMVVLQGLIDYAGGSFNSIATVPAGFRPDGAGGVDQYLGLLTASLGSIGTAYHGPMSIAVATGLISLPLTYANGSVSPSRISLAGVWFVP